MPDVLLRECEQAALRSLLAVETVPTDHAHRVDALHRLARLIGCDAIGVSESDGSGRIVDEVVLPQTHLDFLGDQACDGPLPVGLQHFALDPRHAAFNESLGLADTIATGFRLGSDHVVQVWLDRWQRRFDDRELALLGLVSPALQRLFRNRPTSTLPAWLTVSERRVLQLVAAGLSNADIAERLYVAPSTVRKHLEHSYRKLGVRNRLAAVRKLEGRQVDDPDRRERIERSA